MPTEKLAMPEGVFPALSEPSDAPRKRTGIFSLTDRRAAALLSLGFALFALLLMRIHGPQIFFIAEGDDQTYFTYARTLALDRDLSFQNEPLAHFHHDDANLQAARYAFGPGLLWSPFVLAGHGVALITDRGHPDLSSGLSPTHWFSACLGSLLYGMGGFMFLYLFLRRFFSVSASFWPVLLVGFSSPLLYYCFRRPLMSHSTEFFCLCAAAWGVAGFTSASGRKYISAIAVLTGMLFLCRWNDAPFVASFIAWGAIRLRRPDSGWLSINSRQALFIGVTGVVGAVQLILWKHLVGTFYPGPALFSLGIVGSSIFFTVFPWTFRHMRDLFVGKDWGVFWLSPGVWVLPLAAWRSHFNGSRAWERLALAIPSFMTLWVASNWPSHGGEYGNRYLIPLWLFFSFLGAEALSALEAPRFAVVRRIFLALGFACLAYSTVALSLFKSNADTLTLHVGPTLYDLPSDWVNHEFVQNANKVMLKEPVKAAMTFGPSAAGFLATEPLRRAGALPGSIASSLGAYYDKHPLPPAHFWWMLFIALAAGVAVFTSLIPRGVKQAHRI